MAEADQSSRSAVAWVFDRSFPMWAKGFGDRSPSTPAEHQPRFLRAGLRYASDLSDAEWEIVAPLLPAPFAVGRPREVELREVVNAILFIATTSGTITNTSETAWPIYL